MTSDGASTPSSIHGRFEPGTKFGGRYRVVGLLGRGGMGEVYRADDLELGQSVALKFLPEKLGSDPTALDRFRNEVRTARQIAHPNVCRMYDIGQADGHVFLSMEYIDGEDLAHVLRRMGRPSSEKAIEIARQLCLGLAAAHENGVLHRDLKPANIMIDGRGRVRITDFGLAGLADGLGDRVERAGTPAYMAPEQLGKGSVSVRSDIYALGLVLHEIFTGRRVFDTNNIVELKRLHHTGSISLSSSGLEQIDPAVERVILRCLEQDPQRRPSSVYGVLGALPGGDPLAAAIAAGETPSPALLAEAGEGGGLRPSVALTLLVAGLALMLINVWLAPSQSLAGRVALDTPEAELALRARDRFKEITGQSPPKEEASGFMRNDPYIAYIQKTDDSPDRWERLSQPRPPAVIYWHRFSPKGMTPAGLHVDLVHPDNPPVAGAGSALLEFDPQGRLVYLEVVPDRAISASPEKPVDVAGVLFEAAGLDLSKFEPVDPRLTPPVLCDDIRAYSGPYGTPGDEPAVVQVGSFRGQPNYFEIIGPWTATETPDNSPPFVVAVVGVVALVIAIALAYRNLANNRCDRKGAFRLALFTTIAWIVTWCVSEFKLQGSPADVGKLIGYVLFGKPFGHAFAHAFVVWLAYVALEPYARRIWPRTLVTWTRLLLGRFRDAQLGRDILMGGLIGGSLLILQHLARQIEAQLGLALPAPWLYELGGLRTNLAALVAHFTSAIGMPLGVLVLLVIFRLILRVNVLALAAFVLIQLTVSWQQAGTTQAAGIAAAMVIGAVGAVLFLVVLIRFGVVTLMVAMLIQGVIGTFAVTPDLTQWYAAPALVPVLACAALLVYGFRTSLAGQPLWRDAILER